MTTEEKNAMKFSAIFAIVVIIAVSIMCFLPKDHLGPLDLDLSYGVKETTFVDFIWPHGDIGTIKLPFRKDLSYYVCGIDGTPKEPIIYCDVKIHHPDGTYEGGQIELPLVTNKTDI